MTLFSLFTGNLLEVTFLFYEKTSQEGVVKMKFELVWGYPSAPACSSLSVKLRTKQQHLLVFAIMIGWHWFHQNRMLSSFKSWRGPLYICEDHFNPQKRQPRNCQLGKVTRSIKQMYMLNKYISEGIRSHLLSKTKGHHRDWSNVHLFLYFWGNCNVWHKIYKIYLINNVGKENIFNSGELYKKLIVQVISFLFLFYHIDHM